MVGLDITDYIANAGEKTRLRAWLQHRGKGIGRVWHFPDHVFLTSNCGRELESFRLLDPRLPGAAQPITRSAGDSFLTKLLGGSSPASSSTAKKTSDHNSVHSTHISLLLDAPSTVVQLLRIDDHVFLAFGSDGQVRAYRYELQDNHWIHLPVSAPTPTAGSEITSVGLVPGPNRPYTLYKCQRHPQMAPPWNFSVIRQQFHLDGSPPRAVVFNDDVTTNTIVLHSCPATAFTFHGDCAVLWFPSHNSAESHSPNGLLIRCSTSGIYPVVLGSRKRHFKFEQTSRSDFWSICATALSDLQDKNPFEKQRMMNVFAQSKDRLVVCSDLGVYVVDRYGKILSRHELPPAENVISRQLIANRHLCYVDGSFNNSIWLADFGELGSSDWTKVDVFATSPWCGVTTTADGALLWSDNSLIQITRNEAEKLVGVSAPTTTISDGPEVSLLLDWDAAYRQRSLPRFHSNLRVSDCQPPLEYSVALPLVLVHNSIDHQSVTPPDIERAEKVLKFLSENCKTVGSSTVEQKRLRDLFESYCRVQRVLHMPVDGQSNKDN